MKNLYTKLHAFQAEVGTIKKSEMNPFFKSRYVDINGIIDAIKPLLDKHGLVIMQPLSLCEGKSTLTTVIADIESGESYSMSTYLPENIDPQKMGSAITYFRRYALQSLLLLEAEDDDGNNAAGASQTQNLPPRNAFPAKKVQRDEEPPLPDFNEPTAEDLARMMDGEVVEKATMVVNGKEVQVPTAKNSPFPKFRDCPHENTQHSSYYKCYNCYTKQQDSRT